MRTLSSERLGELLRQSALLDDDVAKLLQKCEATTRRTVISLALCNAAFEHAISQRILIELDLTGTALALARLHFEAVVRAAWTGQGASESWINEFSTPVAGASLREPIKGPPIPSMLDTFARHAPDVAAQFRRLYGAIEGMHSFVHGGIQAVGHALQPYPAESLESVLRNRNLLQLYTANCAVVVTQNGRLLPRLRLLQEKHHGCMPPVAGPLLTTT